VSWSNDVEAFTMKKALFTCMTCCLVIPLSLIVLSGPAWAAVSNAGDAGNTVLKAAEGASKGDARERLNRIDFGNTYIIGQSIKSGAVYLLQRKKSEIKSMLRYREDYRKEILEGFSVENRKASGVKPEQKPDLSGKTANASR